MLNCHQHHTNLCPQLKMLSRKMYWPKVHKTSSQCPIKPQNV